MNLATAPATDRAGAIQPNLTPDRRRHKRVPVDLLGRFMRANRQEHPCRMTDVSVGGAAMLSSEGVAMGERIIAYFDFLGGLEGHVSRVFSGGFALELSNTQHKREKLAAQIIWLINRHELGPEDDRRHERYALSNKSSSLKLDQGIVVPVNVLDVSISGASIGTEARPPIGSEVVLGKLRARVVRHHDEGIAVKFPDIQNADALRRHFG